MGRDYLPILTGSLFLRTSLTFWCLLQPWLQVFPIPGLKRGFFKLTACMNEFRAAPITYAQLNSA